MIYLITGNMGTGKTSRAVNMILTNEDGLFKHKLYDGTIVDRPLYFCHIDGLDAKKFCAHELTKDEIQSAPLDKILPEGAVLIVDEAHWTYPTRSAAQRVPEYVQKLSELRHAGFTLILLTQHPMQLDSFVRNLVSKHIHLERKAIGMKQYWWYKCVTSLDNPAGLSGTESAPWQPPKAARSYYKSASIHQDFKKKVPIAVWVFLVISIGVAFLGYRIYGKHYVNDPVADVSAVSVSSPVANPSPDPVVEPSEGGGSGRSLTPLMYVPTLAEKPESKPLYDGVRQVKTYERIAACVSGGRSGCTCYSDQATPLKEVTEAMCRQYAENGLPFDPFRDQQQRQQQQGKTPADDKPADTEA